MLCNFHMPASIQALDLGQCYFAFGRHALCKACPPWLFLLRMIISHGVVSDLLICLSTGWMNKAKDALFHSWLHTVQKLNSVVFSLKDVRERNEKKKPSANPFSSSHLLRCSACWFLLYYDFFFTLVWGGIFLKILNFLFYFPPTSSSPVQC